MISQGTQMKKNYQPRKLPLRLLSWGIEVRLWKSPSSALTRDSSGAEPGGPCLFCIILLILHCPCAPSLWDGAAGICSPSSSQLYSQPRPIHCMSCPFCRLCRWLFLIPAHSRELMKHPSSPSLAADTWGACSPTQRQLIKAVFLNLYPPPPCSCQQIVPSIFMTPVFQTQGLLEQHKSIFSVAQNYVKGASHRPKVDLRHKCPKQICILEQQHSPVAEMWRRKE